jgi:hypothetical protein
LLPSIGPHASPTQTVADLEAWSAVVRWRAMPRIRSIPATFAWTLVVAAVALPVPPARAASFPPVTEHQKNLTEVSGAPGAEAVVLDTAAEFWMMDLRNQRPNSTIRVRTRVKILTPEGAESYGEVAIPHSRQVRLSNFEGRTVLPDGRELAVDKDAVFRRTSSRSEKEFVTAAAFPAVETGAILDWTYDLSFDSIFYLEPWYLQEEVPVLHTEVLYHIPGTLAVKAWGHSLPGKPFQQEVEREMDGRRLRIWLENVPPLPDEPFSVPEEDLRVKFMLIPKEMDYLGERLPLMDTWKDVCKLIDEQIYQDVGRKARAVKRKAKELAAAAGEGGSRAVAREMYRFVRDDIRTLFSITVFPRSKIGLDDVLESGEGTHTEKALLLQGLLRAADLEADLLWVPNRWDGAIDVEVPNPSWFEKAVVRAHIPFTGGEEVVFLDPSDPRLGFGFLNPTNEDVPALIYDVKDPQTTVIPLTPASQSRRRATMELTLDAEGRITGTGDLELTGHHAWSRMSTGEAPDALRDSWEEWLTGRWEGFEVTGVTVEEDRASRRIRVGWTLAQREEEVLGDEASVQLSRPLGPTSQVFQLEPARRKTPVLIPYPDTDEVTVRLTWPETWEVDAAPEPLKVANSAGEATAEVTVDPDAHSLSYSRNLTISHRQFGNSDAYGDLRTLYERMEKSDAQALVLVAK